MTKHSTRPVSVRGGSPMGRARIVANAVLFPTLLVAILAGCSTTNSGSVATQNVPVEFQSAGFDPPQRCAGECEPDVAVTVDPAEITTPTVDYEFTVNYTFENLAKPSDGSSGGVFVTGFDLVKLDGGGRGGWVPDQSTCPTTEKLPVPAGGSATCTATIRVDAWS